MFTDQNRQLAGKISYLKRQKQPRCAAQRAIPVAVADAGMTASERHRRAIIELISQSAVIGTIGPAPKIERAMVSELRRNRFRRLPADSGELAIARHPGAAWTGQDDETKKRDSNAFHQDHPSLIHDANRKQITLAIVLGARKVSSETPHISHQEKMFDRGQRTRSIVAVPLCPCFCTT
jgi:hypothetical protein